MTDQVPQLEGWFIHGELILALLDQRDADALSASLPGLDAPFARSRWNNTFQRALASYLHAAEVPALSVARVRNSVVRGQLVWVDQAINFKGLREAIARGQEARASFSATLDTDRTFTIVGDYNPDPVTGSTAGGMLVGRKRQFMVGYITELTATRATVRPLFIGHRWSIPPGSKYPLDLRVLAEVWPQQVDQFANVDFSQRLRRSDLEPLREIPEAQIKSWFAEIIGEPEVPKDWGGEQFDLWTDRISIDGRRFSTAVAFKGPAAFHPMTIADLGKNGDQIDRLADTAAGLLVVQHCHAITAPVVNMLRAYATSTGHPRRYMTIDGYNTLRILRGFGHLNRRD